MAELANGQDEMQHSLVNSTYANDQPSDGLSSRAAERSGLSTEPGWDAVS